MRLVTWNAARGQFPKKAPWLDHLQADVAVIQEIAEPRNPIEGVAWFGVNKNQGVAVVVRPPYSVSALPEIPDAPRYFVPFRVTGPTEFVLFAVWTLGDQELKYVRAATAAIDMYADLFGQGSVVVMGDFNSNAIWDREHPSSLNHTALVASLSSFGLVSAYHVHLGVRHGEESDKTFYLHKNKVKSYHIDYCFLPEKWLPLVKHIDIGTHAAWYKASDHSPLLVEVATET
jgi:exodeoxyribonuclease III